MKRWSSLIALVSMLAGHAAFADDLPECAYWKALGLDPDQAYELVGTIHIPAREALIFTSADGRKSGRVKIRSERGKKSSVAVIRAEDGPAQYIVPHFRHDLWIESETERGTTVKEQAIATRVKSGSIKEFRSEGSIDIINPPVRCKAIVGSETLIKNRFERSAPTAEEAPEVATERPKTGPKWVRIFPRRRPEGSLTESLSMGEEVPDVPMPSGPTSAGSLRESLGGPSLGDVVKELETGDDAPSGLAAATSTLKPIVTSDAEPSPLPTAPRSAIIEEAVREAAATDARVCHASTGKLTDWNGPVPVSDYSVAGRLMNLTPESTMVRYDYAADLLLPFEDKLKLGGVTLGRLMPLSLPFGRSEITLEGDDSRKVRPVAVPSAKYALATEALPTIEPTGLTRIVVVADPRVLKRSGLAKLETALLRKFSAPLWTVEWVEVAPDGTISAPVPVESLSKLEAMAAGRSGEFFAESKDQLHRLFDGMTNLLETDPKQVDLTVILLEGQRLPHETPSLFEAFLQRIGKSGNIPRRARGEAREWLLFGFGYTPVRFSAPYLEGPIKTSRAGAFSVEPLPSSTGIPTLFSDPREALATLEASVNAKLRASGTEVPKTGPASVEQDDRVYIFDRSAILSELGLVLGIDRLDAVRGWSTTADPNMITLSALRTASDGAVKMTARASVPDVFPSDAAAFSDIVKNAVEDRSYDGCTHVYLPIEGY